jgi:hypothetical protein
MVLALSSCGSIPPFPATHVYEVDVESGVCGRFKIVDEKRLLFEHDMDLPLTECDGVFGFSMKQVAPVMNWTRDRITEGQERCK